MRWLRLQLLPVLGRLPLVLMPPTETAAMAGSLVYDGTDQPGQDG